MTEMKLKVRRTDSGVGDHVGRHYLLESMSLVPMLSEPGCEFIKNSDDTGDMAIKVSGQIPSNPPLRETGWLARCPQTRASRSGVQADLADLRHGEQAINSRMKFASGLVW